MRFLSVFVHFLSFFTISFHSASDPMRKKMRKILFSRECGGETTPRRVRGVSGSTFFD